MTADRRPIVATPVLYQAEWIPRDHIEQVAAGVHFDAVRVKGVLGADVVAALDDETGQRIGAVILEDPDGEKLTAYRYFLVPAGEGRSRRWPPGLRVFAFGEQFIRVPALWGNTYPLRWQSPPTRGAILVDTELLHRALCVITTWSPLPNGG